jgi:hypothetical protein
VLAVVEKSPRESRSSTLWLWVGAGFFFLGCLWTAMFVVARAAAIEPVPRTTEVRR